MKKIWSLHAVMRTMTVSLICAEKYAKIGKVGWGPLSWSRAIFQSQNVKKAKLDIVFLQLFLVSSKKHLTNTSKRLQHIILLAHVLTFFLLKFLSLCVMGPRNEWHISVLNSQQTMSFQRCHSHFIILVKEDKSWKCHLPSKVPLSLSQYFTKN